MEKFKIRCQLETLSVAELFPRIIHFFQKQQKQERNIMFIDPYGYKEIHKTDIENFLKNGNTEIILFLPISQMHRFKRVAIVDEENKSYEKLRNFIMEFFEPHHPLIKGEKISVYKFIDYIKEALSFNQTYFSTSFYIERDKQKNVYALFFITPNIKGFEKILEAKWDMDTSEGRGFKLSVEPSLFEPSYTNEYEVKLEQYIRSGKKTNVDLYHFGLKNEHIPKHTNDILKKWKQLNLLKVFDIETNKENKRGLYTNSIEEKVWFKLK